MKKLTKGSSVEFGSVVKGALLFGVIGAFSFGLAGCELDQLLSGFTGLFGQ